MLDATAGADAGAPYAAPIPQRPFAAEVNAEPGRLRIAFTHAPPFGRAAVHPDCLQALDASARLVASLGHVVEEAAPPIDRDACAIDFFTVVATETRVDIERAARALGRKPRAADFEPGTYSLGLLGRSISAADYAGAAQRLQLVARTVARFFERYDVLMTPTLAAPPVPIGALQPSAAELLLMRVVNALGAGWLLESFDMIKPLADKMFAYMPYTPLFNVTGAPAMSVPLHWNAAGLPIGIQFAAPFAADAVLFRLAGQLERAQPWFHRNPPGF
jgi:amidase